MINEQVPNFDIVSFGGLFRFGTVFLRGLVQYFSNIPSVSHLCFDRSMDAASTPLSEIDWKAFVDNLTLCGSKTVGSGRSSTSLIGKPSSLISGGSGGGGAFADFAAERGGGGGVGVNARFFSGGSPRFRVDIRFSVMMAESRSQIRLCSSQMNVVAVQKSMRWKEVPSTTLRNYTGYPADAG